MMKRLRNGARAAYHLLKPEDHIDFLITALAVAIIANGSLTFQHVGRLALTLVFSFFIVGGTVVLNQYFDIEVDKVNKPYRPIPSGIIKPITALKIALAAYAFSLIVSLFLGPLYVGISVISMVLSILYSHPSCYIRKSSIIVQVVLINAGYSIMAFLVGWNVYRTISEIPWWFLAFLFISDIGGVFAKDYRDYRGDKRQGYVTLPTLFGFKQAARMNTIIYVVPFLLVLVFSLLGLIPTRFFLLAMYCVVSGIFAFSLLLGKRGKKRAILCYYIMEANFIIVRIFSVWALVL